MLVVHEKAVDDARLHRSRKNARRCGRGLSEILIERGGLRIALRGCLDVIRLILPARYSQLAGCFCATCARLRFARRALKLAILCCSARNPRRHFSLDAYHRPCNQCGLRGSHD
jgi:hypothetical protein